MLILNAAQLGPLIRDSRRTKGWSQAELAKAMGVSRNWIQLVEAGRANASLDMVLQLMQWVDLSVDVRRVKDDEYIDELLGTW